MTGQVFAPWTSKQVKNLNAWQVSGHVHPFTCPNRSEDTHSVIGHDLGTLVATPDGWKCQDCNYTQDWAWAVLAKDKPPKQSMWLT